MKILLHANPTSVILSIMNNTKKAVVPTLEMGAKLSKSNAVLLLTLRLSGFNCTSHYAGLIHVPQPRDRLC
jgi:hypothetical protein